jgi:hypothetical protein
MMKAALFSTWDETEAVSHHSFPYTFDLSRRNAPTNPGIKNAHKARR